MTDNEILKALECCIFKTTDKCDKCILTRYGNDCKKLGVYALDLINRQKAEIERLMQKLQQPQAEAVKEFAKDIHKAITEYKNKREMPMLPYTGYALDYVEQKIDNLLKEMVGEGNEHT